MALLLKVPDSHSLPFFPYIHIEGTFPQLGIATV